MSVILGWLPRKEMSTRNWTGPRAPSVPKGSTQDGRGVRFQSRCWGGVTPLNSQTLWYGSAPPAYTLCTISIFFLALHIEGCLVDEDLIKT